MTYGEDEEDEDVKVDKDKKKKTEKKRGALNAAPQKKKPVETPKDVTCVPLFLHLASH